MRAVCFREIESVVCESIPDASLEKESDAIVKVDLAGLCGSDLHPYWGRETGLDPGTAMGHEFVGHVVELGRDVQGLSIGDRVCSPFTTNCGQCFFCQRGLTARCERGQLFGWRQSNQGLHGGQAELVRVPLAESTLLKIDDAISDESALLLGDNLSTGYFGAAMAVDPRTAATDVLAVVGCGTVGLLSIQSAQALGVQRIYAIDPNPARLEQAKAFGAIVFDDQHDMIRSVLEATDQRGADAVMEYVGLPDAQKLAFELVRPGGRMSVIGCHCSPSFAFSPTQAYDKNLTYITGRCSARFYMDHLVDQVARGDFDLSWCVTHRFDVRDTQDAYEVFSQRKDGCVKAVFEF